MYLNNDDFQHQIANRVFRRCIFSWQLKEEIRVPRSTGVRFDLSLTRSLSALDVSNALQLVSGFCKAEEASDITWCPPNCDKRQGPHSGLRVLDAVRKNVEIVISEL